MNNIPLFPPRYLHPTKLVTHSMNPIYKAFDEDTQQYVAIKVMKGDMYDTESDQRLRQLFQHEINLAHSLHHDHILKAIEAGVARMPGRAVPYITTPYMDEGSLEDFVETSPPWHDWALSQTIDVIMQAASALEYVHRQYLPLYGQTGNLQNLTEARPLVHRDVKLDNFFVRRVYRPDRVVHIYLGDFGIARTQRFTIDYTEHIYGTVRYMPPEQFDGQHFPQSDQYSLAMMACFLLTGRYPLHVDSNNVQVWVDLHRFETPTPPTQLNQQLIMPAAVDDVILKALSKDPEDRYPSVWKFAKELRSAVQKQVSSTPNAYASPVAQKSSPPPELQQPTLFPAQYDDVDNRYDIADISTQSRDTKQSSVTPIAPDAYNWQSLSFISTESSIEAQLPISPQSICWSYDGNYLACLFDDHSPVILDRQGRERNQLPIESGHVACWAHSEHRLAISRRYIIRNQDHSKILIVDNPLAKSKVQPFTLSSFPVPSIDGMDWSSKGQLAVWISEQNCILLYAISQTLTQSISIQHALSIAGLECGGIGTLRWSPDGTLLAAGTLNGALICWRADTYAIAWQRPATQEQIYTLSWSPDSSCLVVSSGEGQITIWDVRQDRLIAQWDDLPMVPRMLSVSNQGLLVAASRHPYLYFRTINTHDVTYVGKHPGKWLAAWSPTRSEFATLHPENDTVLVLWKM